MPEGEKSIRKQAEDHSQVLKELVAQNPADSRSPEDEAYLRELASENTDLQAKAEESRRQQHDEVLGKLALDHEGVVIPKPATFEEAAQNRVAAEVAGDGEH